MGQLLIELKIALRVTFLRNLEKSDNMIVRYIKKYDDEMSNLSKKSMDLILFQINFKSGNIS